MANLVVTPDLWFGSMLPEGVIERWLVTGGSRVQAGHAVVLVRIEDSLHDLLAPADGEIHICSAVNAIIEPGSILAEVR